MRRIFKPATSIAAAIRPTWGVLIGKELINAHWRAARAARGSANDNPRGGRAEFCEADLMRRLRLLSPSVEMTDAERAARDLLLSMCGNCGACAFARVR